MGLSEPAAASARIRGGPQEGFRSSETDLCSAGKSHHRNCRHLEGRRSHRQSDPRSGEVTTPRFDLVGVGLNATDTLILVNHFPAYAGKVPFESEILSPGGQMASALAAGAKLGLRVKYIGTVGDDARGRGQLASLRKTGIDLGDVEGRENRPNQTAYNIIDQSTRERRVLWHGAEAC